jgi:hypothetical protein
VTVEYELFLLLAKKIPVDDPSKIEERASGWNSPFG